MDKQSVRLIISKALEAKLVVKIVHEYLLDRDFTSFSPRKIRAMQNKGTFLLRVVWIQVPEFSWQWSLQCTFNSGSKGTLVGAGPLSFRCVCQLFSVKSNMSVRKPRRLRVFFCRSNCRNNSKSCTWNTLQTHENILLMAFLQGVTISRVQLQTQQVSCAKSDFCHLVLEVLRFHITLSSCQKLLQTQGTLINTGHAMKRGSYTCWWSSCSPLTGSSVYSSAFSSTMNIVNIEASV